MDHALEEGRRTMMRKKKKGGGGGGGGGGGAVLSCALEFSMFLLGYGLLCSAMLCDGI